MLGCMLFKLTKMAYSNLSFLFFDRETNERQNNIKKEITLTYVMNLCIVRWQREESENKKRTKSNINCTINSHALFGRFSFATVFKM